MAARVIEGLLEIFLPLQLLLEHELTSVQVLLLFLLPSKYVICILGNEFLDLLMVI